jgi:hypothetical protein
MLDRQSILASDDLPRIRLAIPQWGGEVFIRTMSGCERDEFEASCAQGNGKNKQANLANIRARLAVLTVCDESGARLFSAKDVEAVGRKSAAALDLIFDAARKANGLGAEDVDELAGN